MTVIPLNVGQTRSIRLVDDAVTSSSRIIGLVTSKDEKLEEPGPDDLYQVGTAAVIHRMLRAPDNSVRLIVQGLERIRIEEFTTRDPYLKLKNTSGRPAPTPFDKHPLDRLLYRQLTTDN